MSTRTFLWGSSLLLALSSLGCRADDESFVPPQQSLVIYSDASGDIGIQPWRMAVGDRHVFWSDALGDLHRVRHDGSDHAVIASDLGYYSYGIAASGEHVVIAVDGKLIAIDALGQPTELVSADVKDVAIGRDRVFWTELSEDRYELRSTPLGGGAIENWYSADTMSSFAVGDDAVFVMDNDSIKAIRQAGAEPTGVSDVSDAHGDLQLAAAHVYWPADDGAIARAHRHGGSAERIESELYGEVFFDRSAVYGFSQSSAYVMTRVKYDGTRHAFSEERERLGMDVATSNVALFWLDWTSECLTWESYGKSQECVEYDNELRLQVVAK